MLIAPRTRTLRIHLAPLALFAAGLMGLWMSSSALLSHPDTLIVRSFPSVTWSVTGPGSGTPLNYRFHAMATRATVRYNSILDNPQRVDSDPHILIHHQGILTPTEFDGLLQALGAAHSLQGNPGPAAYHYALAVNLPTGRHEERFSGYPSQAAWDLVHVVMVHTLIGKDELAAEKEAHLVAGTDRYPQILDQAFFLGSYQAYASQP